MSFNDKHIRSLCGRAVHGWGMIRQGDRVVVGLSGGKDSLSLLWLLAKRQERVPIDYEVLAVHVEMGFGTIDTGALEGFCRDLNVPLTVISSDFGPRAHSPENREKSPCFFCAMHRRKELFLACERLGAGRLALAHHQDDIHETFLMNALFSGTLSSMLPVQPLFGGKLTVIRPLSLVSADMTRRFARGMNFPVQPPCCPSSENTHRALARDLLEGLYKGNRKVRPNLWHALTNSGLASLPTPPSTARLSRSRRRR